MEELSQETQPPKKPYHPPTLRRLGRIADLTRGSRRSGADQGPFHRRRGGGGGSLTGDNEYAPEDLLEP
ncbi:MAG TPA: lasso RiPP family leader peptide-containing protein [Anaerolineaceae bacterium]|nr:lasso RiPP family leader peptide-containing protein [Anaerolineaceae bacterium]